MSERPQGRPFPRGALFGAAAVIAFTLIAIGVSRFGGLGSDADTGTTMVESREIAFRDRQDGAVVVLDVASGQPITVMPAGTNGFVRAAVRGLARQRHKQNIGAEPPFILTRWDDGRHSLEDTATGERIYLEAFGSTQVQTFAELLSAETIR